MIIGVRSLIINQKSSKLFQNCKKHIFQFFNITNKSLKITLTFLLSSKLPKNYKRITSKIQNAPLRGTIGIEKCFFSIFLVILKTAKMSM